MHSSQLSKLIVHQQNILSKIALVEDLSSITTEICLAIESMFGEENAKCSILTLAGQQLFHCAAPSIDDDYCSAINGVFIGDGVGSCGTAAFNCTRVIAEDINTSPLWADYKHLALSAGLQSCWSTPILSNQGTVLGTFAIYHDTPKKPSEFELELINYFVHFTSIALEKMQTRSRLEETASELKQSNEKFKAFTQVMPDLALIFSEKGVFTDSYGAVQDYAPDALENILNRSVYDFLTTRQADNVMANIEKTLTTKQVQIFEYEMEINSKMVVFEGRTVPIDDYVTSSDDTQHVLWMARDITTRKEAEQEIEKLAFYDPLTKLPNRRMLHEHLHKFVAKTKRSGNKGALLFIDLDNFKRINDSLGHAAGDELLVSVANRLSGIVRSSDILARVGGDEFVILLDCLGGNKNQDTIEATVVASKVQELFKENYKISGLDFQVCCSVGICYIEGSDITAENVLKYADTAMYRSKQKGGNTFSFYDPKLQTMLEQQIELETEIVRAINDNEFSAYFQPQVDTCGQVSGVEALIRWQHPVKGLIPPCDFIPVAEQFGLIQKLQNIVLRDICQLLTKLNSSQAINSNFNASINISPSQFRCRGLKNELMRILGEYKISPSQITLEITESMFSHDVEQTVDQMNELVAEGFSISIDDFGTGYSCLANLHDYPLKELKIDRSFISNMTGTDSGRSVVDMIINLAKNLSIKVVAEGVETQEQFNVLKSRNVDEIQGYLFSKPLTQDDYLTWHAKHQAGLHQIESA